MGIEEEETKMRHEAIFHSSDDKHGRRMTSLPKDLWEAMVAEWEREGTEILSFQEWAEEWRISS